MVAPAMIASPAAAVGIGGFRSEQLVWQRPAAGLSVIEQVERRVMPLGPFRQVLLDFCYAVDEMTHRAEWGYRQIGMWTFMRAQRTGIAGWLREVSFWHYRVDPFDPKAQGQMVYTSATGRTMREAYQAAQRRLRCINRYGSVAAAEEYGRQRAEGWVYVPF